ncbi:MAG TPA: hypothetical protein VI076_05425 [Actinopolymorphaceae bacterium]
MRKFSRWYGAGPLHLLALVFGMAIAAYAAVRLVGPNPLGVLLWFGVAIVAHDLVLLPLYSLADRGVGAVLRRQRMDLPEDVRPVHWQNHVRVPFLLSGLLLLVFLPLILRIPTGFERVTGRSIDPYLGRWLWITAALFLCSAVWLAIRIGVARRRSPVGQQDVLDEERGEGLES